MWSDWVVKLDIFGMNIIISFKKEHYKYVNYADIHCSHVDHFCTNDSTVYSNRDQSP
jgi:hypothetical protein